MKPAVAISLIYSMGDTSIDKLVSYSTSYLLE